jgi:Xaa-Pro dipeptidase
VLGAAVLAASIGLAQEREPERGAGRRAAGSRLASEELFTNQEKASHRFDDFTYTADERREEAAEKLSRLRAALAAKKLDGVLIATHRNFEWITGGARDTVVWAERESPVKLLITSDKKYLIANSIEGPRVMAEELTGLGYDWQRFNWYGSEREIIDELLNKTLKGRKIAFDLPSVALEYAPKEVSSRVFDFAEVYWPLTSGELRKYHWLGRHVSEVVEQVAGAVKPGMTERDVQYLLERELWYWDIFPTVVLSAADERFTVYRHPVIIGDPIRNLIALNVCGRRWGMVVSMTRVVHFGTPDEKLAKAWAAGATVCGAMWDATKPGRTLGDVLEAAQDAYKGAGYPDEWKLHHQGGPILTLERLFLVKPDDKTPIVPGMALAWNPTLQGSKFEDTVVVKQDGTLDVITAPINWPTVPVKVGFNAYAVPTLMVRPVPK